MTAVRRYMSDSRYNAVTKWAASTAVSLGAIRRQLATPTGTNSRCFRCTTAGTTGATEPSWNLGQNATTADGSTVVWTECTGQPQYNGDGGGSAWAAPYYHLNDPYYANGFNAGDIICIANDHNETQTSSYTVQGSASGGVSYVSISPATIPPTAMTAGASFSTTGGGELDIVPGNYAHFEGINFSCDGFLTVGDAYITGGSAVVGLVSCTLNLTGVSNTNSMLIGPRASSGAYNQFVLLDGTSITFSNVNQFIGHAASSNIIWRGGSIAKTGTVPTGTALFQNVSTSYAGNWSVIKLVGVDLSAINIHLITSSLSGPKYIFEKCKVNAILQPVGALPPAAQTGDCSTSALEMHNCSSTGGDIALFMQNSGFLTTDTVNYMNSGVSDGTTPYSWNCESGGALWNTIFRTFDIASQFNTRTGVTVTATIYIACNAPTLTNDQIWLEVDAPLDSGSPLTTVVSSWVGTTAILPGAGGAVPTDGVNTWTQSLYSPLHLYKLQVSFTCQQKGPILGRVCCNNNGFDFNMNPQLILS